MKKLIRLTERQLEDIVRKVISEQESTSINLSELNDEMFNKLPNSFVAAKSSNLNLVYRLADNNARNVIGKALADGGSYNISMSGSVDVLYEFKTFKYEQDGKTVYKIIGIKRDSIGGDDLSEEKWNEVLG